MSDLTPDPTPDAAPDLRKTGPAPATPPASIWEPLDGSEARRPEPPSSFLKPQPGTPPMPGAQSAGPAPAPALPGADGRTVFVLAGWWRRFGAWFIDSLVFGTIALLITIPLGVALGMTVEESARFFSGGTDVPDSITSPAPLYVLLALQAVGQLFAQAVVLARWSGQTPGKRALGIRVVRADGLALTLGTTVRRDVIGKGGVLLLSFPTLFLAFFLNYLWPLWDGENRAGHDMYAKTRVVLAPKQP